MPRTTLLRKQVVQAGTIESYIGTTPPEGYLLCDGCIVTAADYPRLFKVIGTSWGYGNNDGLTFHLPDLRGRFLRGTALDSGITIDKDATTRTPNNAGGNSGNNVGTDQNDKTRRPRDTIFSTNAGNSNHTHTFRTGRGGAGNGNDRSWEPYQTGENNETLPSGNRNNTHSHSVNGGGDTEGRPINTSVIFVIKT